MNDLLPDAAPRTGAIVPIPDIGPATKRFRISEAVGMDWMRQWIENWSVFDLVNSIAHMVVLMQYSVRYRLERSFDKVSVAAASVSVLFDAKIHDPKGVRNGEGSICTEGEPTSVLLFASGTKMWQTFCIRLEH